MDKERSPIQEAQVVYESAGKEGFVEDFIERGADDLEFMAMEISDRELWIDLMETGINLQNIVNSLFLEWKE